MASIGSGTPGAACTTVRWRRGPDRSMILNRTMEPTSRARDCLEGWTAERGVGLGVHPGAAWWVQLRAGLQLWPQGGLTEQPLSRGPRRATEGSDYTSEVGQPTGLRSADAGGLELASNQPHPKRAVPTSSVEPGRGYLSEHEEASAGENAPTGRTRWREPPAATCGLRPDQWRDGCWSFALLGITKAN
ncbi:hypothetical protein NDU88_008500 [Pleurodeles waltl]|uniref:Uncharacterized protein n=1 Tax=Pleurodeles waltl TaxID=8319 RepID=A0AAV7RVX8_PLEWA|nr:hypothetical protein NDU88_008500 [Pleurodeles waltl]